MSISSDEISFLIQRYFQECGFEHSLYTFNAESQTDLSSISGSRVPPGALITLLQKGLLYIQLEKEISSAGKGVTGFTGSQLSLIDAALREGSVLPPKPEKPTQPTNDSPSLQLDESNSIMLVEHTNDVMCCAWSMDSRFLATGSSDNSAIIWDMGNPRSVRLQHGATEHGAQHQVSSLDWSPTANILVTGCSDGSCHIWDSTGAELHSISDAKGAIHVVRFDPSGRSFVAGDADSMVVIRTVDGNVVRSEDLKHGPVLDASWRSETAFAVSCDDGTVAVFDMEVDGGAPVALTGHTGTVNGVAWSKSGEILASCGDDKTIRLWQGEEVKVLQGHSNGVYAVRWSVNDVLASSAFDNTVRLWDPQSGECLCVLSGHTKSIYALCFFPDGSIVASGSMDQTIKFWKVPTEEKTTSDGQLLCTCVGSQSIFDLQVDKDGNYVVACFEGGNVFVVPTANLPIHGE